MLSSAAGLDLGVGAQLTVTGVPGSPKLTVAGIATSATGTAQGWVAPSEIAALEQAGAPAAAQMLYDFSAAGTTSAVNKDVSAITSALPHGSVLGTQSWLAAKAQATASSAPWVPFIVAFGLIGLVMSVLIVINVVSGAVVSGFRRIGVLKSLGFSPPQVVAAYVLQVAVPAVTGCVAGAAAGNLVAVPMLGRTARVYGVGSLAMPLWVSLAVPLAMLGLVVGTASAVALRAGRMSAVQAIATGRAPRPGHGYAALRLLGRDPLARLLRRPVTIGLAGPFARPTRTLVTMAAIVFGVTAGDLRVRPEHVAGPGPWLTRRARRPGRCRSSWPGMTARSSSTGRPSAKLSVAQQESGGAGRAEGPAPARSTTWPNPTARSACLGCWASCR